MTLYKHVTGKGKVPMSEQEKMDHIASLAPAPRSTDPTKYSHTRRQFKMLLTDTIEAEIKLVIAGITTMKLKREVSALLEEESVFRWVDPTMVKLRNRMEPAIAEALESAWVAKGQE